MSILFTCLYVIAFDIKDLPGILYVQRESDIKKNQIHFSRNDMRSLMHDAHTAYLISAETGWDSVDNCNVAKKYQDFPHEAKGMPYIGCRCNNLEHDEFNEKKFVHDKSVNETQRDLVCPVDTKDSSTRRCEPTYRPHCEDTTTHVDAFGAKTMNALGLALLQFTTHGLTKHKRIPSKRVTGMVDGIQVELSEVSRDENTNCHYSDQDQTYGSEKDKTGWLMKPVYAAAEAYLKHGIVDMNEKAMGMKENTRLKDVNMVIRAFFGKAAGVKPMGCHLRDRYSGYDHEDCDSNPDPESHPPVIFSDQYGHPVPVFRHPAFFSADPVPKKEDDCLLNAPTHTTKKIPASSKVKSSHYTITSMDCRLAALDAAGPTKMFKEAKHIYYHYYDDERRPNSLAKRCDVFEDSSLVDANNNREMITVNRLFGTECGNNNHSIEENLYVRVVRQGKYGKDLIEFRKLLTPVNHRIMSKPMRMEESLIEDNRENTGSFGGDARAQGNLMLKLHHNAFVKEHNTQYDALCKLYKLNENDEGRSIYYLQKHRNFVLHEIAKTTVTAQYQMMTMKLWTYIAGDVMGVSDEKYDYSIDARTRHDLSAMLRFHPIVPERIAMPDGSFMNFSETVGKDDCTETKYNCSDIVKGFMYTPINEFGVHHGCPASKDGVSMDRVNDVRIKSLGLVSEHTLYDTWTYSSKLSSVCPHFKGDIDENFNFIERSQCQEPDADDKGPWSPRVKKTIKDYIYAATKGDRYYYTHTLKGLSLYEQIKNIKLCEFMHRSFPHIIKSEKGSCSDDSMIDPYYTPMTVPIGYTEEYTNKLYHMEGCKEQVLLKNGRGVPARNLWTNHKLWTQINLEQWGDLPWSEDHSVINCMMNESIKKGPVMVMTGKGANSVICSEDIPCYVYMKGGGKRGEGNEVYGSVGNDIYYVAEGKAHVHANGGNDRLVCGDNSGVVHVSGGEGDDYIDMQNSPPYSEVFGDSGNDVMLIGNYIKAHGGDGHDIIETFGTASVNTDTNLYGQNSHTSGGDDLVIYSGRGNSYVDMGPGNDCMLYCGDGNVNFKGSTGYDTVFCCDKREKGCIFDNDDYKLDSEINDVPKLHQVEAIYGGKYDDIVNFNMKDSDCDDKNGGNHCANLTSLSPINDLFGSLSVPVAFMNGLLNQIVTGPGDDCIIIRGQGNMFIDGEAKATVHIGFEGDNTRYETMKGRNCTSRMIEGQSPKIIKNYDPNLNGEGCNVLVLYDPETINLIKMNDTSIIKTSSKLMLLKNIDSIIQVKGSAFSRGEDDDPAHIAASLLTKAWSVSDSKCLDDQEHYKNIKESVKKAISMNLIQTQRLKRSIENSDLIHAIDMNQVKCHAVDLNPEDAPNCDAVEKPICTNVYITCKYPSGDDAPIRKINKKCGAQTIQISMPIRVDHNGEKVVTPLVNTCCDDGKGPATILVEIEHNTEPISVHES